MRSALEEEEEELAPFEGRSNYGPADREVTISSTTLLAIFFGLALICALFFAFGYTLGRRSSSDTSQPVAASRPTPDAGTLQLASTQGKPSAGAQSNTAPAPPQGEEETGESTDKVDTNQPETAPESASVAASRPDTARAVSVPRPVSVAQSPATTSAPLFPPAATTFMVQIAAVSNPADADVLVSALHKRGYSVAVRRETGDALMHVQVGPFQARADAVAMRQKLLADGYNAILK